MGVDVQSFTAFKTTLGLILMMFVISDVLIELMVALGFSWSSKRLEDKNVVRYLLTASVMYLMFCAE